MFAVDRAWREVILPEPSKYSLGVAPMLPLGQRVASGIDKDDLRASREVELLDISKSCRCYDLPQFFFM